MSEALKAEDPNKKLVDVIKTVSNTKEFSNIINNISESINKLDKDNASDSEYNLEDYDSDDDNIESILGAFFMDKDGNNICDCLSNINKNLELIVKSLGKSKENNNLNKQ